MTAHNLKVNDIIKTLKKLQCEYVDARVVDELTLAFAPSPEESDEEEGEIDIKDTII